MSIRTPDHRILRALVLALTAAAWMGAAEPAASASATAPAQATKTKPYTLDTCIVSGDKIGTMGAGVKVVRGTREVTFCCKGCIKDFDKDQARFLKKIDEAETAKAAGTTAQPATAAHQH